METILFGGTNCKVSIKDYLQNHLNAIAVQIEHGLRANKSEEQIKTEMLSMFSVERFNIKLSESSIKDIGSNHYENRTREGQSRRVLIKNYYYIIPFDGEPAIFKYRPETFHGSSRKAEIIGSQSEKIIRTMFESEENFQAQFNHAKSESIGSLSMNCDEANKEIDAWNRNLENKVSNIYPQVKSQYDQTLEFNRRNNIK